MSGLFSFLRKTFRPTPGTSNNKSSEEESDSEQWEIEESAIAYRESLSSYVDQLLSVASMDFEENADAATGTDDFSDEEEVTTYDEWRLQRNRLLTEFVIQRLVNNDPESDIEEDENISSGEEDTQGVSQELQTQQLDYIEPDFLDTPIKTRRNKRTIPHVDQTLHHVTTVSGMDLDTKSISLNLCRVERVWKLRETRRCEHYTSTPDMPQHIDPHLPLPFFPFGHSEDDGPLQTVFKTVLSMEVNQLDDPDQEKIRQTSLQAFSEAKLYRRVMVFFHNKYAMAIQAFLDKACNIGRIMISLDNIPAKCIFPYHAKRDSFFDQDIAKYCIVIGEKSSLRLSLQVGSGDRRLIYFSDDDMEIQLGVWDNDGMHTEIVLNSATVMGTGQRERIQATTLQSRYDVWEDLHQKDRRKNHLPHVALGPIEAGGQRIANLEPHYPHVARPTVAASPYVTNTRPAQGNNTRRSPKRLKTLMTYHKLNELEDLYNSRMDTKFLSVNVIGVVLGFGAPSMTRRSQWMISLSIVDDSLPLPGAAQPNQDMDSLDEGIAVITLCVFSNHREGLPVVHQAGDVLRLKCVGVQVYNNQIQLLASSGRGSSIVVVRPKGTQHSAGEWQLEASPETVFQADDVALFQQQWNWGQKRLLSHPTMRVVSRFRVADIGHLPINSETGLQDAIVMVTSMFEAHSVHDGRESMLPRGFLRIWDGTGPPQSEKLPIATAEANEAVLHGEPPSAVIGCLATLVHEMDEEGEDPIEPPKSLCGKVANLAIWEDPHWDLVMKTLRPGKFVRLRNISQGELFPGLEILMVQSKSWLTPVPDKTFEVRQLLREHDERILRGDPFNPQSGVMPLEETDLMQAFQGVNGMSGNGVTAAPSSPAVVAAIGAGQILHDAEELRPDTIKKCISEPSPMILTPSFRITKVAPNTDDKVGLRDLCVIRNNGVRRYQFVIYLEDDTAEIEALGEDLVGLALFGINADAAYSLDPHEASKLVDSIRQPNCLWSGVIRSVEVNGAKFFVLLSVSKLDSESA